MNPLVETSLHLKTKEEIKKYSKEIFQELE